MNQAYSIDVVLMVLCVWVCGFLFFFLFGVVGPKWLASRYESSPAVTAMDTVSLSDKRGVVSGWHHLVHKRRSMELCP